MFGFPEKASNNINVPDIKICHSEAYNFDVAGLANGLGSPKFPIKVN